jgi:hypothetical protein
VYIVRYVTDDSRVHVSAGRFRYVRYARGPAGKGGASTPKTVTNQLAKIDEALQRQQVRGTCAGTHAD